VSVVLDSKPEMPLFPISGALEDILARSHQFDDRERKVGKMIGIGSLTLDQKIIERFGIWNAGKLAAVLGREFYNPGPAFRGLHHAPDRRHFVAIEHARHDFIGGDHEIFDEFGCAIFLPLHKVHDLFVEDQRMPEQHERVIVSMAAGLVEAYVYFRECG